MKTQLGVLSLAIVLGLSQAVEPHVCNQTLGPEELHQVEGAWILVCGIIDTSKGQMNELQNMTSSHMEIHVRPDNHTLEVKEHTVYGGGKCVAYTFHLTLPQDHKGHHQLHLEEAVMFKDGEAKPYPDDGKAEFFPSSENTMRIQYISEKHGSLLMVYHRVQPWSKPGSSVLEDLKKNHPEHQAMAHCLNLHGDSIMEWHYNGEDFCDKTTLVPSLDSDHLHQVDGDWVLDWSTYDKTKFNLFQSVNLSSSFMEMRVQPDNHTVVFTEHNHIGQNCKVYKGNLVLPQSSDSHHHLHLENGVENLDGVDTPYQDSATAVFFQSSQNTMKLYYKSQTFGSFLLVYRRDGHHREDLEKDHSGHREKATFLGLSGDNFEEWHYDGVADFCHKKSAPEKVAS